MDVEVDVDKEGIVDVVEDVDNVVVSPDDSSKVPANFFLINLFGFILTSFMIRILAYIQI